MLNQKKIIFISFYQNEKIIYYFIKKHQTPIQNLDLNKVIKENFILIIDLFEKNLHASRTQQLPS